MDYTSVNNHVANSELLHRGINPFPGCLTMHEARRLVHLASLSAISGKENEELLRLQAKIKG